MPEKDICKEKKSLANKYYTVNEDCCAVLSGAKVNLASVGKFSMYSWVQENNTKAVNQNFNKLSWFHGKYSNRL